MTRVDNNYYYNIGGHYICLRQSDDASVDDIPSLLPSFQSFSCAAPDDQLLFTLTLTRLRPVDDGSLVRDFDTGNGHTAVYQLPDGGYQYIVRDIFGHNCCLLICRDNFSHCQCTLRGNPVMSNFGLNNALMLIYAFAGISRQTMLIHASCIAYGGKAFPFFAKSGTGKSTHTSLWLAHIEGTELLNDDNPIIRIMDDGQPYVYGSPWSGKTPCYRNRCLPLGALSQIERSSTNNLERLPVVKAFAALLPAFSSMKWDEKLYDGLCNALSRIMERVPVYSMHCRPDAEAAQVCHQTLSQL